MKLTKKIVSLAAVLALSCTFAVSAVTLDTSSELDIALDSETGVYTVDVPASGVAETDQYTVLVYKIGDNSIDTAETDTFAAPSSSTITYIDQDSFSTISADDAYTIAFSLGAVDGDGTYTVIVGGTGVATAAVGYFEIGGTDEPEYTLGDVDGNGVINATDAGWVLKKYADSTTVLPCGVDAAADVVGNGTINATDAGWVLKKYADSTTVFPAEQ